MLPPLALARRHGRRATISGHLERVDLMTFSRQWSHANVTIAHTVRPERFKDGERQHLCRDRTAAGVRHHDRKIDEGNVTVKTADLALCAEHRNARCGL